MNDDLERIRKFVDDLRVYFAEYSNIHSDDEIVAGKLEVCNNILEFIDYVEDIK